MVGYSFWGFLGDIKYNKYGQQISAPDGNAFYSWSIISELQKRGKDVVAMNLSRDSIGIAKHGDDLFSAFAKDERFTAYGNTFMFNESIVEAIPYFEYIMIEWRWEIPGRNTEADKGTEDYQPDLENMKNLIKLCQKHNVPFVIFDLDYKLTEDDIIKYDIKNIIELGTKWNVNHPMINVKRVKIPFDFSHIHDFPIKDEFNKNLVYVGNRYERDWCIDKYIPEDLKDVTIYGNWIKPGYDTKERWPKINFESQVQTKNMYDVYSNSATTILLAKKEYCDMQFMTARIIESVFYGCLPLFIEEFGSETITQYAGKFSELLTVRNKKDVEFLAEYFVENPILRKEVIEYLRNHLRFMDCKFFIDDVERMLKK